jgi:hypothetical protein
LHAHKAAVRAAIYAANETYGAAIVNAIINANQSDWAAFGSTHI